MHVSLSIPDDDKSAFAEMGRALEMIYGADTKRGYDTTRSNSLPGEYARRANRLLEAVKFEDTPEDRALKTAVEAAKEMLRMQGHAEAATRIAKTANELQNLRDILPSMAARLSIEVGRLARDLEARAQQHRMDSR